MRVVVSTTGAKVVLFPESMGITLLFFTQNGMVFDIGQHPLQKKDAFRSHIEHEVENAEIGQESVSSAEYLIIGFGMEICISIRMLRMNAAAIIDEIAVF